MRKQVFKAMDVGNEIILQEKSRTTLRRADSPLAEGQRRDLSKLGSDLQWFQVKYGEQLTLPLGARQIHTRWDGEFKYNQTKKKLPSQLKQKKTGLLNE